MFVASSLVDNLGSLSISHILEVMGVPVWARQGATSDQPSSDRHRPQFPIHKLDESPVIAAYTNQGSVKTVPVGSRPTTPSRAPTIRTVSRSSTPVHITSTPARGATPVNPGEIVWEVKREYTKEDSQVGYFCRLMGFEISISMFPHKY